MDLNERQKCVVSGLFFVTDETHCMSRIREIVTHYGQQDAVTCCQRDVCCVRALIGDDRDTV